MVSCIIPAYKCAGTIRRCLNSVLASEHRDFEVLVVLNGPDDGTEGIALEYGRKDARVRVIKNDRAGSGAARNLGLESVRGEYVCFCDADDAVQPRWMGTLLRALEGTDAQLSSCTYRVFTFDDQNRVSLIHHYYFKKEGRVSRKDFLMEINGPYAKFWGLLAVVWTKMYRASILTSNKLRYDEAISYPDDYDFNLRYLRHCKRISVINEPLYDYYTGHPSITSRYHAGILDDYKKIIDDMFPLLDEEFSEEDRAFVYNMLASMTVGGMVRLCRHDATITDAEIKQRLTAFAALSCLPGLYACYQPAPGQSADIPSLTLAGDVDALFATCRRKSEEAFKK